MKIALMLSRCDVTGMTTNTLDLYSGLKAINSETYLVVGKPPIRHMGLKDLVPAHYEKLKSDPHVIFVRAAVRRHGLRGKLQLAIASLGFARALIRLRPDIVHVESPYYTFIPWLLRKKFVSTVHICSVSPKLAYVKGQRLIAISEETLAWGEKVMKFKRDEIDLIPHGVSPRFATTISDEKKQELKRHYGLTDGKILIGLVGSIEPRKGHDILLKAFIALPESLREQSEIVFVGSAKTEHEKGWLDSVISETNTQKYVKHIEHTDPENLYKLFDIFVLPSRMEGFALVVIEAMLSGCCCVRSNTEGASLQIEDGVHGRIFKNEDVGALTKILQELIEDPALRKRLAETAKERALKEFTSDIMTRKTYAVYEKVLKQA